MGAAAAAALADEDLVICSHDMSGRSIPPLKDSVLATFGPSVDFNQDVQLVQAQVRAGLGSCCGCGVAFAKNGKGLATACSVAPVV